MQEASFNATIRYGCLALAMLVVSGLLLDSKATVVCGLLATGAAYIAQAIYTQIADGQPGFKVGVGFQFASLGLWVAGLLFLI